MNYRFSDIFNNQMYSTAQVIFVLGSYDIFNNIVIDRFRELCVPPDDGVVDVQYQEEMAEGLPVTKNSAEITGMNTLDINTFMEYKNSYPMEGRWFCSVDYMTLNQKQKDAVKNYIRFNYPSGMLVVNVREYRDYREFLRNNLLQRSPTAHMIQLTFPSRFTLQEILRRRFKEGNVKVADKAIQLFIMRLSNDYDSYEKVIENIIHLYSGMTIGIDEMTSALKGIDNYILDDFIEQLTKPMKDEKVRANRKIYKMYKSILDSLSAKEFVLRLSNRVDLIIQLRMLINDGTIPILVRYGAAEIQDKLPENSRLKTLSTYSFKRYAKLASLTSLRDWYYIKMILQGTPNMGTYKDEEAYNHILLSLIHRTTFSPYRLVNDLGIINVVDGELYDLNTILYNPNLNLTEEALLELIEKNKSYVFSHDEARRQLGISIEQKIKRIKAREAQSDKDKERKEATKKLSSNKKLDREQEDLLSSAAFINAMIRRKDEEDD